jgi:hypothetical protein
MKIFNREPKGTTSHERGQTTAEFVLIVPFLLLFFFLIVDFGWMLKNWVVVTNAARETARCAATQSCEQGDGTDIEAWELACNRLQQGITGNLTNEHIEVLYGSESVVVQIEADNEYIGPILGFFSFVTGGSLPDPMVLRAREEMRIEIPPDAGNEDEICS